MPTVSVSYLRVIDCDHDAVERNEGYLYERPLKYQNKACVGLPMVYIQRCQKALTLKFILNVHGAMESSKVLSVPFCCFCRYSQININFTSNRCAKVRLYFLFCRFNYAESFHEVKINDKKLRKLARECN